jgi:hypothetical protein
VLHRLSGDEAKHLHSEACSSLVLAAQLYAHQEVLQLQELQHRRLVLALLRK